MTNLDIDCVIHPTLHNQCHHHIVYGKLSDSNMAPPLYTSRIWYYTEADFMNIMKSIDMFHWHVLLGKINCHNEQVKLLNEVLSNIYSNFIPNKVKKLKPRPAPWITTTFKVFLRKRNHAYAHFMRNGQANDKLEEIQKMISDGANMIEDANKNYLRKSGQH